MPAKTETLSTTGRTSSAAARNKCGVRRNRKVSELVFRIEDVAKYEVGESICSPTKLLELFNYQLEVYPMGEAEDTFSAYICRVPVDGVDSRIMYEQVNFEITLVNQRNNKESITKKDELDSFPADESYGFDDFLDEELRSETHPAFFDDKGGIVIRARVDITESKLSLVPAEKVPVEPDEQEIKIGGVADFEKGEDIKFRPVWRGSYRTQVAVYPGGHPDHAEGEKGLAAYIHILDNKNDAGTKLLKLKVTVVNHKAFTGSITWTGTFQPGDAGDDINWGPNRLLSIEDLLDEDQGWLDEHGALIIRASVNLADEGRDPHSFTRSAKKRRLSGAYNDPQGEVKVLK
ncbi:hypothetical protein FOZ63_015388 [Perkinsus olseni]|uniref:MATH domain-containing protein n=1 Tax=Perkinsus olseni TaxID=32597 RepID=A0A7J6R0G3_PEROL|nr:hypothetical protein FOZ63_015388 [Perkinsus olseni]